MTRLFSHETGRLDAPLKPRNLQRTARQASLVEGRLLLGRELAHLAWVESEGESHGESKG